MPSNASDTRERIADVFKKHFTYFGFKKTSVDEVAKELKISKKTIYQFFSSKEIKSRTRQGYSVTNWAIASFNFSFLNPKWRSTPFLSINQ